MIVDELLTAVSMLSDGETQVVVTPLTRPLDQIDAIARLDWRGDAKPIEIDAPHVDAAVKARR